MFNKTSLFGLVLVSLLFNLITKVEATYSCCLKYNDNLRVYSTYCDNSKTQEICKRNDLYYNPGFLNIGNGCDLGSIGTEDTELRNKQFRFEDGCGGHGSYKFY